MEREAVRALANLWIDYTLLANAVREDTTMAQVDVTPLVDELVAVQLITALRDSMISVPPISNAELQQRFRSEGPGSTSRARQILLSWPDEASDAQKDSVRHAIEALRTRIVDGREDFAKLARERSEDPAEAPELAGRWEWSGEDGWHSHWTPPSSPSGREK